MPASPGTTNEAELDKDHLLLVHLVKLELDTPEYIWTGRGDSPPFGGNTYVGVGELGSIGKIEESLKLSPNPITLTLSGLEAPWVTEALDATNFDDRVTVYEGYLTVDWQFVDDPFAIFAGRLEHMTAVRGDANSVSAVVQSNLAQNAETNGRRWSRETQSINYSGDTFFDFADKMIDNIVEWGGRQVTGSGGGFDPSDRDRIDSESF